MILLLVAHRGLLDVVVRVENVLKRDMHATVYAFKINLRHVHFCLQRIILPRTEHQERMEHMSIIVPDV